MLQSTSLLRGKTSICAYSGFCAMLQSTSLLRGKTSQSGSLLDGQTGFNPLPSCEGRREKFYTVELETGFNPLPSGWGSHIDTLYYLGHSLGASFLFSLARQRSGLILLKEHLICFNPLPSCEGRPAKSITQSPFRMLQSTSLLRGKTLCRNSF